jgi:hypothetical protein
LQIFFARRKPQPEAANTMPDSESQMDKLDAKLTIIDRKLDEAKGERKDAQVLMTFLTVLITSVVGFAAWFAQSRVQQHIDDKSKELETILALKQEVYSRELDRYESVHQQMAALVDALVEARADPTRKKAADDAINKLYLTYTTDSLYLSNEVVEQLKALVKSSGNLPVLVSSSETTTKESADPMHALDTQIILIENQMKQDLRLSQLGQIPTATGEAHP